MITALVAGILGFIVGASLFSKGRIIVDRFDTIAFGLFVGISTGGCVALFEAFGLVHLP